MMKSLTTKWPDNFDPDDDSILTLTVQITEGEAGTDEKPKVLHTHRTGQLLLAVSGVVGIELEDGPWSVPTGGAVWTPAGVPHTGVLGPGGRCVCFHVGACALEDLPKETTRYILNPLTIELLMFSARGNDKRRCAAQRERLSWATIEEIKVARHWPAHFAPLPRNKKLQGIAPELVSEDKKHWTVKEWATHLGMSERTLGRQIQQETGMTFSRWRLQHVMLASVGMLMGTTSIEYIADALGYNNTSAFIAAFKSVIGMTPGQYRRSVLQQEE